MGIGAKVVSRTDDLEVAVRALGVGETLCIQGPHRVRSTVQLKSGQHWVGVTPDAAISGAQVLTGWVPHATIAGVWVYSGPLAAIAPHTRLHYGGAHLQYPESQFQDDVFFQAPGATESARMFRVLSLAELTRAGATNSGLVPASVEVGRFFFDYPGNKIFINRDPSGAVVDLATVDVVVGQAPSSHDFKLTNLTLEKGLSHVVGNAHANTLTMYDVTIRFSHNTGIFLPVGRDDTHRTMLKRVLLTNNGQYAINAVGSWYLLEDTEFSWNNIASYRDNGSGYYAAGTVKFNKSQGAPGKPGLWLNRINSHHNVGDGFWTDVHNQHVLVENSQFHHNERSGYFHEISCEIELRNNTFFNNGQAIKNPDLARRGFGLLISTSNNGNAHHNLAYGNAAGGISLVYAKDHDNLTGIQCASPASDVDTTVLLKNNSVHDNQIYSCVSGQTGADENRTTGWSSLMAPRGNAFTHNTYHVPSTTSGTPFVDISPKDWATWHANYDTTGTALVGCTYP